MPATGNGDILPRPAPEPPSVVVITKDEEANIEACLRCLDFTDDVVVLDSGSTDRTTEIARYFANVSVIHRAFDTEWKQRNHALHGPKFKHPWVYICDADERVDRELVDEMLKVTKDPETTHAAFRLRYRNMFMGRWINHASTYPVWIIRLVRPERVTYEVRETNIHPIVDGTVGELSGHFTHYSFNSGLVRWFQKHNFYSTREAIEGAKIRAAGRPSLKSLRNPDPMLRRRAAKNLSYFLPGRALWRFAFAYGLRGGFRDGRPGLHYCLMTAMYEYWIELKMKEIERGPRARVAPALARRMLAAGNIAPTATPGQTIDAYLEQQIQSADAASDERLRSRRAHHRVPARPAWRFFSAFILRGGFLRGRAGYHLARLDAGIEYITGLLHRDKRLRASSSSLAPVLGGEGRGEGAGQRGAPQRTASNDASSAQSPMTQPATRDNPPATTPSAQDAPTAPAPTIPFQRLDLTLAHADAREYARRFAWALVRVLLFRPTPKHLFRFRNRLLRWFGAKIAYNAVVSPTAHVFHPWLLEVGDWSHVGAGVNVYNLGPVSIGAHTVVSQGGFLCAGTHDYTRPDLPLVRPPIRIGSGVWIAAEAFVGPNVTVGDNAVVGARAVVSKDVPPGMVVAGNPARVVKAREMQPNP